MAIDNNELLISAEIAYATKDRQELISLQVAPNTTIEAAIELSALSSLFPDEPIDSCPIGIWGRLVARTQVLQEGDRVELYRALPKDPRDARRERAAVR